MAVRVVPTELLCQKMMPMPTASTLSDANADQDAIVLPSDDEGAIVIPSDDAGVASMMALVEVLPIDLIIKKPASVVRLVVRMNGCARQPKSSLSMHFGLGAQRLTAGVGDG